MAHQEFGFEVIKKFLEAIAPFGHPDFQPKLIGRGINVMISPLPRNKRAKNPYAVEGDGVRAPAPPASANNSLTTPTQARKVPVLNEPPAGGFVNNPFDKIEAE
jgi:translation initiation factor IF-3